MKTEVQLQRCCKPSKIKAQSSRSTCKNRVPLCTIIMLCNTVAHTETVLLIFSLLQTTITSQMWPSGGKSVYQFREESWNVEE